MATNTVPGFLPSVHGFHFPNAFPSVPALSVDLGIVHLGIGNAGYGLCGGMCLAARDRFERGDRPPADGEAPAAGTPLFRELARRQLDSFDRLFRVPLAFWRAVLSSSRERERLTFRAIACIRREIDAGRLAMVGLVRMSGPNPFQLARNHQVLAYGYDFALDRLVIRIYDPNHPDRDDIELLVERRANRTALSQSTGEAVRAIITTRLEGNMAPRGA